MKVLLFSFFLTGLSLVASEDSIDSGNSRIAQRIFSDLTKCQSEIIVVNSSLVAVEKDEEAAYNYLQFLYQQAASEPMRPISLAYATNLLDGYKQIARCGIPAESIAIGDQLQESLNVLEKGGLSINNFFYRNLSIPEMHACKAVHDICFQHKININEGFCDSISGVHVRIQQLLYQKINLEQQKVRLLESLQVYHKIMTDIESDKLTSSSDVSSSLHSENKGNFVENVQNNSKQSAAIQIQALYRMSRAKHISQVAAQDICQNIAKALLYEILDGVDQSIHKKNQEKKEAYDILCRQMQAGIDKKDLEKKNCSSNFTINFR